MRPFDTPCRAVLCCAVLGVLNQPGQYLRTAKNCYHQWDFMHASKHPHPAHTDTPTANNTQNKQHSAVVLFIAYLLGRLQRTECQLHFTDFFCLGYLAIFHSYASFIHRAVDSYAHIKEIDWFDTRRKQEKIMFN